MFSFPVMADRKTESEDTGGRGRPRYSHSVPIAVGLMDLRIDSDRMNHSRLTALLDVDTAT